MDNNNKNTQYDLEKMTVIVWKLLLTVVLWFEGERHSLPCPVAGHGHGSDDDIEWHYNDSSLLTEENGRLTVSRVSLSLNNTVLRCVGPKGVFEYRVQVEGALSLLCNNMHVVYSIIAGVYLYTLYSR